MKIGYSLEGSTDRAFVTGLRDRWCPHAELVEGYFRGATALSQRREIPKTCEALIQKGVDVIVFLIDGNGVDWKTVKNDVVKCVLADHQHIVLIGIPDRNIECWLCCDATYASKELGIEAEQLNTDDPKGVFEGALGISRDEKQEQKITQLVKRAPVKNWLNNRSFENFYEDVLKFSQRKGCDVMNERQN